MDNDEYITFMALHSHPILENLIQLLHLSGKEALELYYNSLLYRLFEREDTKLWHFSNIVLADLLCQEITTGEIEFPVEG